MTCAPVLGGTRRGASHEPARGGERVGLGTFIQCTALCHGVLRRLHVLREALCEAGLGRQAPPACVAIVNARTGGRGACAGFLLSVLAVRCALHSHTRRPAAGCRRSGVGMLGRTPAPRPFSARVARTRRGARSHDAAALCPPATRATARCALNAAGHEPAQTCRSLSPSLRPRSCQKLRP